MVRLAMFVAACGLAGLAGLAGCILPVSTGAPMPATTVGKGSFGLALSGEAPTLDLLADGDQYEELRGAAPAAAMTLSLSYGLGDSTDLELAGEGALYYFIVPLPTGGSIGLRQHLGATELFDFAVAAKLGGVTSGASSSDNSGNTTESTASATYGAVQGVVQARRGWLRPLASINVMPFQIRRAPSDEPAYRFAGLASSVTLGVMAVSSKVQVGPYFTLTNFESERFEGGFFTSFGLMLAIRPDRNEKKHEPVMPVTPYYAPPPAYPPPAPPPYAPGPGAPPYAPAPGAPPYAPAPEAPPAPAPAPAPGT